ncbi:MAG TPA: biotin--[acetyl-CoA-carboxylase] ligase [Sedimentisphaerales bacterium]|nr:biotin--[acetyl-CoA-carboxylase] ligase [Sedimentisphaerales bacterium]
MPQTDLLDPDKIGTNLRTKLIARKILVYSTTSSTNDIAAEYAKNPANDGLAVFAEQQSAGRGRGGSKWLTGRADSILCSIVLTHCGCSAELLALTCAVAVAEAIGKVARSEAKIKWPNDVRLKDKKVAGILLESKKYKGNIVYIVGMGINCHQRKDSFPAELRTSATSIDVESRTKCDRISLAKRLLTSMDHWLEAAEKSPKKVIDRWRNLSVLLGQRVTLVFNRRRFTGNCIGVDPEKGLILQLESGGVRMFDAAHTTIAK